MYRVFLERAAERDIKKLSVRLHDRVISAIQGREESTPIRLPKTYRSGQRLANSRRRLSSGLRDCRRDSSSAC